MCRPGWPSRSCKAIIHTKFFQAVKLTRFLLRASRGSLSLAVVLIASISRQLREHHPPKQALAEGHSRSTQEQSCLHEGSDGYLLPSLVLSETAAQGQGHPASASSVAVAEDWYRVPPRPAPIQPYMICEAKAEQLTVKVCQNEERVVSGTKSDLELEDIASGATENSDGNSSDAGTAQPAFVVQPRLTGRPSGSYLPMAPLAPAAPIRKTKSVISPPPSLLPGPIAKSHSFSVVSPRVPARSQKNQSSSSSSPKFSDLILGDQAFQGNAVSRYVSFH